MLIGNSCVLTPVTLQSSGREDNITIKKVTEKLVRISISIYLNERGAYQCLRKKQR